MSEENVTHYLTATANDGSHQMFGLASDLVEGEWKDGAWLTIVIANGNVVMLALRELRSVMIIPSGGEGSP